MEQILGPVASYVQAQWLQSCLTLCNPMDCSPPGSSVPGILQARILEWVAIPFFRGSSPLRVQTCVSCIVGRFFTSEPPGKLPGPTCPCTIKSIYWHMIVVKESAPLFQGIKQRGEWLTVISLWTLRNGIFSAISVNKDVTGISNCSPPLSKGIQEGEEDLLYSSHQTRASPYNELWGKEAQDVRTGYWSQIAEIHMKRMISDSPDSCIFLYTEKGASLSVVKKLPAMQETWVWSLGWKDILEMGMATHLQYSYLENPMDRGAWQTTVHGVAKIWTWLSAESDTTERLNWTELEWLTHIHRKVLNSLTWNTWFSLITNDLLMFRVLDLCCKASM